MKKLYSYLFCRPNPEPTALKPWFYLLGLLVFLPVDAMSQESETSAPPEKYVIMGKVTARSTDDPIAGAYVVVDGTDNGTITDAKGEYILMIERKLDQKLTFSFLGMETQTVVFNGETRIDVVLYEQAESIPEVVVTGYANLNKEAFAGSVVSIDRDEISRVSPSNIASALQVFDPSFRLQENIAAGANPNAMPEYYLRGQTAINTELSMEAQSVARQNLAGNNNLPIFVLDGFEVSMEKIYDMDPSRLHKVSILKDAAATALYGSRAANGVIVIESRAPQPGKLNINYKFTGTLETPDLSGYNLMNSREKLQAEVDAGFYTYDPEGTSDDYVSKLSQYRERQTLVNMGVNTDWLAQGVRNSWSHRHDLIIEGGQNDLRWGVDLRYSNNPGVMLGSKRDTYGGSVKIDYRIGAFQIMNVVDYTGVASSESPLGSFSEYAHKQPYDMIRDPYTGKYTKQLTYSGSFAVNPLYESAYLNSYSNDGYDDFTEQLQVRWNISSDLFVQGRLMLEKYQGKSEEFIDPYSASFINDGMNRTDDEYGSLTIGDTDRFVFDANLQAAYNKTLGDHFINAAINASIRQDKQSYSFYEYVGFSSGASHSVNDAAKLFNKPSRSESDVRRVTTNAYVNYTYRNIYLFDAAFSLDASSEFAAENKVAPFWSVAAGINAHNYGFLKDGVVSLLRIKGSYGLVGRVNYSLSAARNVYQNISTEEWFANGAGYMLAGMGNKALGWEKTRVTDASLELGFFNDRLYTRVEYYNRLTQGMINNITIPSSSGFTTYTDNIGQVRNRGVELDLRVVAVENRDWHFSVFGRLATNKNTILKLSEAMKAYNKLVDEQYADYEDNVGLTSEKGKYAKTHLKFVEGGSTTSLFAMRSLGIDPATGKELYLKRNGDITYEWNASEMVIVGNTEPKATGSFGFNARWKNFDLFTSFLYTIGADMYNSTLVDYVENVNLVTSNADKRVGTERWKTPGDVAPLKDIAERYLTTRPTSRFVQKENKVQFLSLDLGYNFDRKLLEKWHIGSLRVSATLQDLGYWSSIRRERGLDYPFSKTYNLSVQITF